jgi:deoxyhypusine monooxygenase
VNRGFQSVDPAAPLEEEMPTQKVKEIYLDNTKPLYIRYKAMFTLRNLNNEEAVLALAEGFEDSSELFRHEIGNYTNSVYHQHG